MAYNCIMLSVSLNKKRPSFLQYCAWMEVILYFFLRRPGHKDGG